MFFTLRKTPWTFCVDISISSVSGRGSQEGGTWRTLRVPNWRHGGHVCSWCHEWCSFTPRKLTWKFHVDISIRSASGRGGQEGMYLEDVEGSWPETWRTWLFLRSWMMFFSPQGTYPEKFVLIAQSEVCQEGGDLEDVEGSWPETWRTWLFLMSWMMFFYPKEYTLKISCW